MSHLYPHGPTLRPLQWEPCAILHLAMTRITSSLACTAQASALLVSLSCPMAPRKRERQRCVRDVAILHGREVARLWTR